MTRTQLQELGGGKNSGGHVMELDFADYLEGSCSHGCWTEFKVGRGGDFHKRKRQFCSI